VFRSFFGSRICRNLLDIFVLKLCVCAPRPLPLLPRRCIGELRFFLSSLTLGFATPFFASMPMSLGKFCVSPPSSVGVSPFPLWMVFCLTVFGPPSLVVIPPFVLFFTAVPSDFCDTIYPFGLASLEILTLARTFRASAVPISLYVG